MAICSDLNGTDALPKSIYFLSFFCTFCRISLARLHSIQSFRVLNHFRHIRGIHFHEIHCQFPHCLRCRNYATLVTYWIPNLFEHFGFTYFLAFFLGFYLSFPLFDYFAPLRSLGVFRRCQRSGYRLPYSCLFWKNWDWREIMQTLTSKHGV